MYRILQRISLIISILVSVYILISGNYTLFPLITLFLILSLLAITPQDFKEGRKAKGSITLITALSLLLFTVYTLLN
ncbi:hypothetical protein APU01nite_11760 [Alkalibacterium putridalgicola]|uniref:DUF3953 domain-containing protein n=1 Tax=Alkalibacterium putridalgicola TaxID=426703 RepID=A0ABQ0UXG3_9LACT|nr:hypothetical protein APU01nite_11760 [Alkalibacterium putridalgicola]